jgi:hypothetical protein
VACSDSKLTCETLNPFRHFGRTPRMGDQPIARPLPTQDSTTRRKADIYLCLERDLNPRSQRLSGPRRRIHWGRRHVIIINRKRIEYNKNADTGNIIPRRIVCTDLSRGSSVSIVIRLRDGRQEFNSRQGQWWDFLSSPPRSDVLWGPRSLISNGNRELLPQR